MYGSLAFLSARRFDERLPPARALREAYGEGLPPLILSDPCRFRIISPGQLPSLRSRDLAPNRSTVVALCARPCQLDPRNRGPLRPYEGGSAPNYALPSGFAAPALPSLMASRARAYSA